MDLEGLDGSRGVQCIPRGSVDVEVLFNGSRKVQWVPRLSRDNGSTAPSYPGIRAMLLLRYPGISVMRLPAIPG